VPGGGDLQRGCCKPGGAGHRTSREREEPRWAPEHTEEQVAQVSGWCPGSRKISGLGPPRVMDVAEPLKGMGEEAKGTNPQGDRETWVRGVEGQGELSRSQRGKRSGGGNGQGSGVWEGPRKTGTEKSQLG
jgi:hypothetical protein